MSLFFVWGFFSGVCRVLFPLGCKGHVWGLCPCCQEAPNLSPIPHPPEKVLEEPLLTVTSTNHREKPRVEMSIKYSSNNTAPAWGSQEEFGLIFITHLTCTCTKWSEQGQKWREIGDNRSKVSCLWTQTVALPLTYWTHSPLLTPSSHSTSFASLPQHNTPPPGCSLASTCKRLSCSGQWDGAAWTSHLVCAGSGCRDWSPH